MPRTKPAPLNEELLKKAAGQLAAIYDAEYGGFGSAPKFPSAHDLIFLQRYAYHTGDKAAKEELENTLRQMYKGGIYDHFGGGFARYSTDREWLAPHFEKTLYDNAMLALCYTEAWQNSRMALYRQVAEATLDYCLRELRADSGGFYCGQDADSGGEEGAHYLFTPAEVKKLLGELDLLVGLLALPLAEGADQNFHVALGLFLLGLGEEHARFDVHEVRGHGDEFTGDLHVHALALIEPGEVLL